MIVTNTEPDPVSLKLTVPTEPDTPTMLFDVNPIVIESAAANGVASVVRHSD